MILDGNNQQDEAQVNMTPLIDVSLVLVVILLLLTPLALESGMLFERRTEAAAQQTETETLPLLDVHLLDETTVEVDGRRYSRESLLAVLNPRMEAGEYRGVAIDCAGWITHGAFVNVLDQARLAGADEIAVEGL